MNSVFAYQKKKDQDSKLIFIEHAMDFIMGKMDHDTWPSKIAPQNGMSNTFFHVMKRNTNYQEAYAMQGDSTMRKI